MEAMGVDVVIVHTGLDERHAEIGKSPLDDLKTVRPAVTIPLQAVGGLSIEQAAQCPALGASLVVIGAPLAVADYELKPGADADKLFEVISSFVRRVKERPQTYFSTNASPSFTAGRKTDMCSWFL
jgi:3-hexulose-6-phosphate synthase/6-phospho-3-hexuloisomerase